LGTEGYSPRVVALAVRQGSKASSFKDASDDLRELAGIRIGATQVQRLCGRIGGEWAQQRDREVQAFREQRLACSYAAAPKAAAVMLDGGRVQTRAADSGRGVHERRWRETKVACCLSLSSQETATDPQPEPPAKFLDPPRVAQLAADIKRRVRGTPGRVATPTVKKGPKKKKRPPTRQRLRTVVATMADSETFGWQMVAEVHRRGLDRAQRKACVCDGQKYNWSLYEMHLAPSGFFGILDFVHLVAYLHDAAHACQKGDHSAAWKQYEQWMRWAWSGQKKPLLASLRRAAAQVGKPTPKTADEDPRRVLADTVGYVQNNLGRMDYPHYRKRGLPISSAPVESTIKQINRRVKGSEKFWLKGGAEAMLQLRAAYLSEDDRVSAYWSRPRPYARAAGPGRFRRAA
jgi:hypothetical protein